MAVETWSGLPMEIIDLIFCRVVSFADRVRFRGVCRWWRLALSTAASAHASAPPYLYFVRSKKIYCLIEKRKYFVPFMRDKSDCRPFGSSSKWLSLVDSQDNSVFAFNPLSGARVDFPSLCTLPDVKIVSFNRRVYSLIPEGTEVSAECLCDDLMIKTVFISPANNKAVMIYRDGKKLAFASRTSEHWTQVDVPTDFPSPDFRSIAGCRDHKDRFYATNLCGATIVVDLINDCARAETVVSDDTIGIGSDSMWCDPNLLSLPTGELLYLCATSRKPRKITTFRIDIRRLVVTKDGENCTPTCEPVERLDGWTIFMNTNGSWARSSREAVGYRKNCIYFNLDYELEWKGKSYLLTDNGVFDIMEKRVQKVCSNNRPKGDRGNSLWIEPTTI